MCQGPGAVSYTDIAQGVKTCLGLSSTVVEFSGLYSMPTCPVALGFKKLHWLYVWDKTVPGSISTRVPVLFTYTENYSIFLLWGNRFVWLGFCCCQNDRRPLRRHFWFEGPGAVSYIIISRRKTPWCLVGNGGMDYGDLLLGII